MTLQDRLHKLTDIKIILVLFTVPFMLICPLALSSILTGFPYSNYINNNKLNEFEKAFNSINLAETTQQLGTTYSLIGNYDSVLKCDLYSVKILNSKLNQKEISEQMLENFQLTFEDISNIIKDTSIVSEAELRIYPIQFTEDVFIIPNTKIDISKVDFGIDNNFDPAEGENQFMLILQNMNVISSRDYRCNDTTNIITEESKTKE